MILVCIYKSVNPTFITPVGYIGVTFGTNPTIQRWPGGPSLWDALFLLVGHVGGVRSTNCRNLKRLVGEAF